MDLVLAFLSALLERRHSCLSRSPCGEAVASARLIDVGTLLEHVETLQPLIGGSQKVCYPRRSLIQMQRKAGHKRIPVTIWTGY